MNRADRPLDAIESRAAAWLARRDGGLSVVEQAEFERWCAADPRHAAAIREIAALWAAFDQPAAESLRAELRGLARRDRRRWLAAGAALATAACLAVIFGLPGFRQPAGETATLATRVIEPERQILADGSIVELRPGAKFTAAFTAGKRVVILEKGEAHFSVTKDSQRPFVVESGPVRVCAVGTAFTVGLGTGEVEVMVTEGSVRVDSTALEPQVRSEPTRDDPLRMPGATVVPVVAAGQRVVVPLGFAAVQPAVTSVSADELTERLSWRLPRLEFSETSIGEAIRMFNRHNRLQLYTTDESVAALRVTGMFRSDNVEGFVRALETSLDLRTERQEHALFLHRRK